MPPKKRGNNNKKGAANTKATAKGGDSGVLDTRTTDNGAPSRITSRPSEKSCHTEAPSWLLGGDLPTSSCGVSPTPTVGTSGDAATSSHHGGSSLLRLTPISRARFALWVLLHSQIDDQRALLAAASKVEVSADGTATAFSLIDLEVEATLSHLASAPTLALLRRHIVGTAEHSSASHATSGAALARGGGPMHLSRSNTTSNQLLWWPFSSFAPPAVAVAVASGGASNKKSAPSFIRGASLSGAKTQRTSGEASAIASLPFSASPSELFGADVPRQPSAGDSSEGPAMGFASAKLRADAWRALLCRPLTDGSINPEHKRGQVLPSLAHMMQRELTALVAKEREVSSGGEREGSSSAPSVDDATARALLLGPRVTGAFPSFIPEQVIYNDIERSLWVLYPNDAERLQRRRELKECLFRVLLARGRWGMSEGESKASSSPPVDMELRRRGAVDAVVPSSASPRDDVSLYHYYQGLHEVLGHILHALLPQGTNEGEEGKCAVFCRSGTAAYENAVALCGEAVARCFAPMCRPSLVHSEAMLRAMHAIIAKEDPLLAVLLERVGLGPSDHFAVSWLLTWFSHEIESQPALYFAFDLLLATSAGDGDDEGNSMCVSDGQEEGSSVGGGDDGGCSAPTSSAPPPRQSADRIIYWCAAILLLFSGHIRREHRRIVRAERSGRMLYDDASSSGSDDDNAEGGNGSDADEEEEEEEDPMLCFGMLFSLLGKLPRSVVATPMAVRAELRRRAVDAYRVKQQHQQRGAHTQESSSALDEAEDGADGVATLTSPSSPPPRFAPSAPLDCFSVIEVFEVACRLTDSYPLPLVGRLVAVSEHYAFGGRGGGGNGGGIEADLAAVHAGAPLSSLPHLLGPVKEASPALAHAAEEKAEVDVEEGGDAEGGGQRLLVRGGMRKAMSATLFGLVVAGYVFSAYTQAIVSRGGQPPQ